MLSSNRVVIEHLLCARGGCSRERVSRNQGAAAHSRPVSPQLPSPFAELGRLRLRGAGPRDSDPVLTPKSLLLPSVLVALLTMFKSSSVVRYSRLAVQQTCGQLLLSHKTETPPAPGSSSRPLPQPGQPCSVLRKATTLAAPAGGILWCLCLYHWLVSFSVISSRPTHIVGSTSSS